MFGPAIVSLGLVIGLWQPRGEVELFEGCGTIASGPQACLGLIADSPLAFFVLENTDGFGPGGRGFGTGVINFQSAACQPLTLAAIEDNTIAPCFQACGVLIRGAECVLLQADSGRVFTLENLGAFGVGDRVYVTGVLDENCVSTCFVPCVTMNTIELCLSECGTLGGATQGCVLFVRDNGQLVALENAFGPDLGARVYVSGVFREQTIFCFPFVGPGIEDNIVGECFSECGALVQGAECVLFETLTGEQYVLDHLGSFEVGDRVRVQGIPDRFCVTTCLQGNGCVHNNTISGAVADVNCDGVVDVVDLVEVISNGGPCPGEPAPCPGDTNGDGVVDVKDLSAVILNWG